MKHSSGKCGKHGIPSIRFAVRIAVVASLLSGLVTLAALGARWHWLCDLTTHWPVQLTVGTGLVLLFLLCTRRWKLALLPGMVVMVNGARILPLFLPAHQDPDSGPVYRVVSANVHTSNPGTRPFVDFIEDLQPDFFLALEVDDRWQRALVDLNEDYPHSIIRTRQDAFGIAFYSRLPITSHRVVYLADSRLPTIVATLEANSGTLTVIGTHPLPPLGRQRSQCRDRHLRAVGELALRMSPPVLVLGDLNTTSWSPGFRDLLQRTGLRDSRRGYGVQPTWPTRPWVLRIPIDHALLSEELVATARQVGPDIGSDHLPIVLEFVAAD